MAEEERYRRKVSSDRYTSIPPQIEGLEFNLQDFSTPIGRWELARLM